MNTPSVIIAARRSPVAPRGGALAQLDPHQLAAPVLRACLADAGLSGRDVDELIAGNALGAGGNPARLMALAAGLPERVGGLSLDRQCCSGLDAIRLADAMIRAGQAEVILAGGSESYSRRPLRARPGTQDAPEFYDSPPFTPDPARDPDMAEAAAALAQAQGISRADQDRLAVDSHRKAMEHRAEMRTEIVSISDICDDQFTRNIKFETAQRARPLIGPITPANMAVAADGAAFCLVVSQRVAHRLARQTTGPALRIGASAALGGDPCAPGIAPVAAIDAVLRAENRPADRLHCAEIMEAFAVQAIAVQRGANIPAARVNPGGGALARGHPIGASGAILTVRLYHTLKTAPAGAFGLAAIAAAGGLGSALALHRDA